MSITQKSDNEKISRKTVGKTRDSNLELFRIISMLGIVSAHYVNNSGLTASDGPIYGSPMSGRSIFLLLFGAWGKIGINCFVMITGYFMCKSQITAKKFAKLVCEFMFYRFVFYLIFLISGYSQFSIKTLIKVVIPITSVNTNFTGCFVVFWLFIPFLNVLVQHMNERLHIRIILLSTFLYVILGTVKQVTMNYVSWFIVLYFISSYIRLYPKKSFSNTKLWGIIAVLSVLISATSVVACVWLGTKINRNIAFFFVTDSNTFLAAAVGVCAFMFFKNIKVSYNKFINTVATSTFGVLCIHANSDTMRQWLWKDTLDNVGHYSSSYMPLHAFGSVIGIFAVCVVIDMIRINYIEKPFFKFWDKHWDSFLAWFQKKEEKIFKNLNVE